MDLAPPTPQLPGATALHVELASTTLAVDTVGEGDGAPLLLVHGFPHARGIWREVAARLVAAGHRVIAPDLRGLGESAPATDGFGARGGARDLAELLDALEVDRAHVVGIDLGVASAFGLAAWSPERVATLTLIEGMVGDLPGAEALLAGGGPWWFGLHQAPGGLAEDLLTGDEDRYVRFFLGVGSQAGVPGDLAAQVVAGYTGRERLHAAFEHYRAMPIDAQEIRAWSEAGRLGMPVLAVGAVPVGSKTADQLRPFAPQLSERLLEDCGHIVPVDAPQALTDALLAHVGRAD